MSGAAPAAPPAAIGRPEPRRIADLPGPRGLPLLGNAAQIRPRRAHIDFENWARRYGTFYRARLGPHTLLVVSDPAAIQAMLRDRPEGFRRPSPVERIAREMGTDIGLFLAEGAEWRRGSRRVSCAPTSRLSAASRSGCAIAGRAPPPPGPRSISMPTRNAIRSMSSPVSPSGRM
jgi:hypothetical protein